MDKALERKNELRKKKIQYSLVINMSAVQTFLFVADQWEEGGASSQRRSCIQK